MHNDKSRRHRQTCKLSAMILLPCMQDHPRGSRNKRGKINTSEVASFVCLLPRDLALSPTTHLTLHRTSFSQVSKTSGPGLRVGGTPVLLGHMALPSVACMCWLLQEPVDIDESSFVVILHAWVYIVASQSVSLCVLAVRNQ